MHWIIQENFCREAAWDSLVEFLERMGIPHSVHKVVPFVGELIPEPVITEPHVIVMGSYSLRHPAKRHGWVPGVFDLHEQDFEQQRRHWGEEMLNFDSRVCAFRDIEFGEDPALFIRPVHDSKVFSGKVYEPAAVAEWKEKLALGDLGNGSSLSLDTLVQVCVPKIIYAEYRYWIVDGQIVTKSEYKRGDQVVATAEVDERIDEYVRLRIAEWQPAAAFVIDVCETPDGPRIVEINTLNAAGYYAANLPKLVMALEAYSADIRQG